MKFAISLLSFRPGEVGGAETYVRQFVANLPTTGNDRFVLVTYRDNADAITPPKGVDHVVIDLSEKQITRLRTLEAFTPLRAHKVEDAFAEITPDAVFFPQQTVFPKRIAFPCVLSVGDVQHLFFPQYFTLATRLFRKAIYGYSLRRADRIIAVSEYTRRTLIDRCRVEPDRVLAVPHGVAHRDVSAVEPTKLVPPPYLYYPAATFPHKNHETLLRTFAALKKRPGISFPYRLVLTGTQTDRWPAIKSLIAELGLKDDVIHPGFLPFEEVLRIYKGADAVVFPTQFEGFGLPVTEAVEFGKKVITSRLEIFDEIGVPRKFQIDFANPDELLSALAIPGPTTLEKSLSTWPQNVQATVDMLREVTVCD